MEPEVKRPEQSSWRSTLVRARAISPAVSIGPEATLLEAAEILQARNVTGLPVVEGDRLLGVLTTTDLVTELARSFREPGDEAPVLGAKVRERMSTPAQTIDGLATMDAAARAMAATRTHRLIVTDEGGPPFGVLAARDFVREVKDARIERPLSTIMTTLVETVDLGDPLGEATRRLAASYVHGLVVLDGSRPIGVFTHVEALALRTLPRALRGRPVEEAMSYETICVDESMPLYRAAAYMDAMDVRRVLVTRRGHLVGIVSPIDLVIALTV